MNEQELLIALNEKLDTVIKLLIAGLTVDKQITDQIKILAQTGIKPKEIARILGTTPNTVRVTLSRHRNK